MRSSAVTRQRWPTFILQRLSSFQQIATSFAARRPSGRFWQSAIDTGVTGASLETIDVESHGDTAIEIGRYRLLAAGEVVADQGKYIVVWKNANGAWKLHHDIWTTSQAAAVPSA
jgi:ketosteroid isomerase-like protein